MTWKGMTGDWHDAPVPRNECDLYHLVDGLDGHSAPTGPFSIIMACLIRYCRMKTVVELGVYKGGTTVFLADACRDTGGTVWAVDQGDCTEARERLARLGLEAPHCIFVHGKTNEVPFPLPSYQRYAIDLLFIDAGHAYEEIQADWDRWTPHVRQGGWVFVDNTLSHDEIRRFFDSVIWKDEFMAQWNTILCQHSFGMGIFKRRYPDESSRLLKGQWDN